MDHLNNNSTMKVFNNDESIEKNYNTDPFSHNNQYMIDYAVLDEHSNSYIDHDDLKKVFTTATYEGQENSASDLLQHLTFKFNRLLEALKQEESDKKKFQKQVMDLACRL